MRSDKVKCDACKKIVLLANVAVCALMKIKSTVNIVSSASVAWMVACASMAAHASGLNVTNDLRFHVDANIGVTVGEGNRVTRWADQSGNGFDLVQSTESRQPIARTGAYGAAVYFNASNWMGSVSSGICYANHTILAVVQPDVNYSTSHGIGDLMGSNADGGYGAGDVTSALKSGENSVQVTVANKWSNRMIGDERKGGSFPGTWNVFRDKLYLQRDYPASFASEGRSPDGYYGYATLRTFRKEDELFPAGLIGPVRLVAETKGAMRRWEGQAE